MDFERAAGGVKPHHAFERPGSDIKRAGYLKKLKTNKKKYFVLRSTSSSGPARLEYHDSEKKFKTGHLPKRSIQLHTCFNINRHSESRHCKNGIVLYTYKDSFVIVADSPEEQEAWLSIMLEFQDEYLPSGDGQKEHYEHVWQIILQPKGLGVGQDGHYRVCLNNTSISIIKSGSTRPQYIIQLLTIRNIAQSGNTFCMEVGKYAPTGEGKFLFQADDIDIVKDMHNILHHYMNNSKDPSLKKEPFRPRSESHSSMSPNHRRPSKVDQRPASFYTQGSSAWRSSMDTTSPGSVSSAFSPTDHFLGSHRPRSDTGDSRVSRGSSQHEDNHDFFMTSYKNGDLLDTMKTKDFNVVPPDMSPPPSPKMLDGQLSAYLEMDASLHSNHSASSNHQTMFPGGMDVNTPISSPSGSYMAMSPHSQPSSIKGDLSPSLPESSPSSVGSYMSMAQGAGSHFPSHMSAPIPIHPHVSSHPPHSGHPTHSTLPTVREGGSNEGYLPMDNSSSPASSSNLRPEPVKCMLSLDSDSAMGLPPRTYSLGSKPMGKPKYQGYMDMGGSGGGPRKGSLNNDMSRAISAPHIIHKGRRDKDHLGGDSPIPSPLSMSIKSDDSDSFMEYMPMRPRTASDSFNYRPRTSSLGKLQPMCRPRSSSHGQGTRPVTKFSKLAMEQSRISQEPLYRTSRESSLHDSFDSLRVSTESLRRHSPIVNEQGELMRGATPPPPSSSSGRKDKEVDSYMAMDIAANAHKSTSPHRVRTDSSGSGYRTDHLTSSQDSEYTEMAPISSRSTNNSESEAYMNMAIKPRPGTSSSLSSSLQNDSAYVNMDLEGAGAAHRSDNVRSVSVENVDSYIMYDPAPLNSGSKMRTGSVGSKDKKVSLRVTAASAKKGGFSPSQPPNVSASTRKGGSSDSIRKPTRQSSMEKYGSLGKDFRKKSGSTGSRPKMSGSSGGFISGGGGSSGFNMVPVRKSTVSGVKGTASNWKGGQGEDINDEYIEFSPTAYRDMDTGGSNSSSNSTPSSITFATSGGIAASTSVHHNIIPSQSAPTVLRVGNGSSSSHNINALNQEHSFNSPSTSTDDSDYTPYAPSPQATGGVPPPSLLVTSSSITPPTALPSSSSSSSFNSASQNDSDYTPFAPGPQHKQQHHHYHAHTPSLKYLPPSSGPKNNFKSSEENSDYIGYDPSPRSATVPSSELSILSRQRTYQQQQQHHSSLDASHRSTPAGIGMHTSSSLNFDSTASHQDPSSSMIRTLPFNPATLTFSFAALPKKRSKPAATTKDDNEYLSYNPATPKGDATGSVNNGCSSSSSSSNNNNTPNRDTNNSDSNNGSGGSLVKAPCLIGMDETTSKKVQSSNTMSSNSSSMSSSSSSSTKKQNNNTPSTLRQDSNSNQQKQQQLEKQVLQQQRPSQNVQQSQQLKASSSTSISCDTSPDFTSPEFNKINTDSVPSPIPHSPSQSPQPPSPLPAVSENTPPWNTSSSSSHTTRQKHASGSSTSSQKSRRISGDSDKVRKNSKSDSNSSIASCGSKTKRRAPSGEKSPQSGSAEKSPLSPSKSEEFFYCTPCQCSGKSLEAKMVPVESKIRHSLGDMSISPGPVGSSNRDNQQGLSRPGSTPCIQHLDTTDGADQSSRLAGNNSGGGGSDNSSGGGQKNSTSCLIHSSPGSRSRHSLSDLGAYQQMNIGGGSLQDSSCGSGVVGSGTCGSNSGSGESCGSGGSSGIQSAGNVNMSQCSLQSDTSDGGKPLNYAQLDLSSSCGSGDSEALKAKSRNSSDADEKQPPLSYAKIDFVKSQNLNKVMAFGGSGDGNSSKS